ncbi:MAG TPA: hypothetical protein GXX20_00065 [Clostridiaceae bacterium]|nr:hypothetical protein [Clostridiaceae bacterium]
MKIQLFDKSDERYVIEAANLLAACSPHAYSNCAFEEMNYILYKRKSINEILRI